MRKKKLKALVKSLRRSCRVQKDMIAELRFALDLSEEQSEPAPPVDVRCPDCGRLRSEDMMRAMGFDAPPSGFRLGSWKTLDADLATPSEAEPSEAEQVRDQMSWLLGKAREELREERRMRHHAETQGRYQTVTVQADEQLKRSLATAQERERAAVAAGRALKRELDELRVRQTTEVSSGAREERGFCGSMIPHGPHSWRDYWCPGDPRS
jgi:hypothetical protein